MAARLLAAFSIFALMLMLKCGYDDRRRKEGESNVLEKTRDSLLVVKKRELDSLVAAHLSDTLSLRQELVAWQRLKQRIKIQIESLPPDTIPGPPKIVEVPDTATVPTLREVILQADATIQRCTTALGSCENITSNLRSRLTVTEQQRDLWQKRAQPSLITRTATAVKWLGVGYILGRVGK